VYEPFNDSWMPVLSGHLSHFTYFNGDLNASPVVQTVADKAFRGLQGRKQLVRAAMRGYWSPATRSASRVIVKDPTALLMTEWIAEQFKAQILIVMRHPCGFASSLDALNWPFDVNTLLHQENLMQDHLEQFEGVIRCAEDDKWLTHGAIWASAHTVFARQMKVHADWHLCKYEDLCNDPAVLYTSLAQKLGLELSHHALNKIQSLSVTDSSDSGSTRRNSKAMPDIWQQRMSSGQVDAVMGIVNEFGLEYY
jgi:hypothetical protein